MCGFVAFLTSGSSLLERQVLMKQMLHLFLIVVLTMKGACVAGQALFGHRRLAVIDIEHGKQPMLTSDQRYSLVFNGEIYNYLELRKDLEQQGCRFHTQSDTEVLLQLLREANLPSNRSTVCLHFVFHDRVNKTWIAARDHFGIKPLYFSKTDEELLFTSEIKSLLIHPEIKAKRDDHSLHQYLSLQFCLDDRTLFDGIKR